MRRSAPSSTVILRPAVFTADSESLVATIAAQAAVAMDNARLTENLTSEIAIADAARQLQRETSEQLEQAFQAMAESSRRLRQALDAGALGTWSWDMATDRLDLDERAAELLFAQPHIPIRRAELRRRIVHTDDLPNTPADLGEAVLNGGTYSAEYRAEGPDKTQRWIAARGLANFNEAQKLIGMIGTVQDITDRKTQEASLRQSEKLAATGRLAATIAHEINNPLEAVTNLIYLCKTDTTVPPAIQHLLETADEELARVAQIAQQTLGFYRDTTRPGEIDLSAMLHGIVDLFSRKLQFKRLACRTHIQPGLRIFGLAGRDPPGLLQPLRQRHRRLREHRAHHPRLRSRRPRQARHLLPHRGPRYRCAACRSRAPLLALHHVQALCRHWPWTLGHTRHRREARRHNRLSHQHAGAHRNRLSRLSSHRSTQSRNFRLTGTEISPVDLPTEVRSNLSSLHLLQEGRLMFAGTLIPLGRSLVQDPRDEFISFQQQRLEQPL